jgi:hypothetical protein
MPVYSARPIAGCIGRNTGNARHEGWEDRSPGRTYPYRRRCAGYTDHYLSEKTLPVPELNIEVQAVKGFNIIATANNRDKGVNELSSALKRRFNTVILPLPDSIEEEIDIVRRRVESFEKVMELPAEPPALQEIRRIVTIFRELRGRCNTGW